MRLVLVYHHQLEATKCERERKYLILKDDLEVTATISKEKKIPQK